MPEPLKNLYNEELIDKLCQKIETAFVEFDSIRFKNTIFDEQWEQKALKQRMRHISETLYKCLPSDYETALEILKPVSSDFSGFEYMFFPDYVELYGLDEYEASISALEYFTQFSSSEFAVRPFIKKYKQKMMAQMEIWAKSTNYHVRRLATEGSRPRLPWAMALPEFKENPESVLKILEILMNDKSEYVRRSVANNLNDISKDNPQIVIKVAKSWLGKSRETDKLIKHACRSLLKQGQKEVLQLFGLTEAKHIQIIKFQVQESVQIGNKLAFSFSLTTEEKKLGLLRIEYAIDFVRLNGQQSKKVFKISESDYSIKTKKIDKYHSFKIISTRKYYPGIHRLSVIINGKQVAETNFLIMM